MTRSRPWFAAGSLAAGGFALAGCQAPHAAPIQSMAAPTHAPYHARYLVSSVSKVISGSPAGLVVGGGPMGGNPALRLTGMNFTETSPDSHSYLWAFAPGAKLLDRDCHPISQDGAIAIANGPGDKSVIFIDYLDSAATQVAPPKVEIWDRAGGNPANCQGEEMP
jgi:hypothetical protein